MKRRINSILGKPFKISFFPDCATKSVEGVEAANCSLENLFLCKLIPHEKTFCAQKQQHQESEEDDKVVGAQKLL